MDDGVDAVRQAYQAYYQRLVGQLYGLTGDLSVAEVATALGVPAGTVKARLSRGRAALARHLSEDPQPVRKEAVSHA
ncbi:RNA polymerase sigma factor [Micromonospora sp. NPDC003197]